jgi:phosphotransacetylase
MITSLDQIVAHVKGKPPKRLAVACGEDPHTIEAVGRAVKGGFVKCSDVAVIPAPDLDAKVTMLGYAISAAQKFGIEKPKAVLL